MHTDSDDNSESHSLGLFILFWFLQAHAPARGCALCACMSMKVCCAAEGPEVCYTQDGQGQSCIPGPSLSPSSLTLMLSWDVSVGDGFPGNRLLSVLRGWCGRLLKVVRGGGRRGYKVVMGGGESYRSKVNNFQPLFRARLFLVSHPSL